MDSPRHAFAARLRDATFWPRFAFFLIARTARPPGGLAAAVNAVRNDISASGAQLCVGDADLRRMTCRRSGHSRDHVLGAFTTRIDHAGLAARGTCAIAACALGDDAAVRCCNNVRTAEKQSPARQPGSFVCAEREITSPRRPCRTGPRT